MFSRSIAISQMMDVFSWRYSSVKHTVESHQNCDKISLSRVLSAYKKDNLNIANLCRQWLWWFVQILRRCLKYVDQTVFELLLLFVDYRKASAKKSDKTVRFLKLLVSRRRLGRITFAYSTRRLIGSGGDTRVILRVDRLSLQFTNNEIDTMFTNFF